MQEVTRVIARIGTGDAARTIDVRGRIAWCLNELVESAPRGGFTSLEAGPALRVSDYVFKLRKRGVPVTTKEERHGGTYKGTHARYSIPDGTVEVVKVERAA